MPSRRQGDIRDVPLSDGHEPGARHPFGHERLDGIPVSNDADEVVPGRQVSFAGEAERAEAGCTEGVELGWPGPDPLVTDEDDVATGALRQQAVAVFLVSPQVMPTTVYRGVSRETTTSTVAVVKIGARGCPPPSRPLRPPR